MSAKRSRAASPEPGLAARAAGDGLASGPDTGAAFAAAAEDAVVRRTADGWRVGNDELPDLTCAMVLADLLAAELPTDIQHTVGTSSPAAASGAPSSSAAACASGAASASGAGPAAAASPSPAPPGAAQQDAHGKRLAPRRELPEDEASRLRTTIGQLEHALMARVRIEQAIGVLAERHRIRPRQAFEQLRAAARNRGRRVIDIASDVVASASNPLLQLPEELSRQRSAPRHARPARRTLSLE